jgi:auxin efflux carrier family protein
MAWIVKKLFWVPYRFRYGIFIAGGWGNYGDLREFFRFSLPVEI